MNDIIVRGGSGRKLRIANNKKPPMVFDFPKEPNMATKKKKPKIKHMSFQCHFNNLMDYESSEDKLECHGMDICFGLKLENVPMSGSAKYEIMDEIKKAVEKVKEKYS